MSESAPSFSFPVARVAEPKGLDTLTLPDEEQGADAVATAVGHGRPPAGPGRRGRFSFSTFDSLSDRSFRWYFFSMFGWFASMNMQMVVRGWLVYELTGSYAALAIVQLANAIPGFFLSLYGGVIADRFPKKLVVQIGQVGNTTVGLVLTALMLAGMIEFWHLLACGVVQGGIGAIIMPARQSMIAEIVEDRRLMNAVALNTAAMNVMRLIAPAFGGLMLGFTGPGWVYLVISGLYLWSGLSLLPVRLNQVPFTATSNGRGGENGSLGDILEGLRYIRRDKTVLLILTLGLAIVFFSMPYQMLLPGFAKDVLDAGPGLLGILMSVTGMGALLGSLVIATLPARNRGLLLLGGSLLLGVSLVAFSVSSWLWVTIPVMVFIGIGQAFRMSLGNVLLQAYTQPEYRGRVMSVYMLEFSITSFMVFVVGMMGEVFGIQLALGACSAVLVVIVLGAFAFSPRTRSLQ